MANSTPIDGYPTSAPRECLCHPAQPELHLIGIDHHHATTEIREKVYMDRGKIEEFIRACVEEEGFTSTVPLCTCNRTELYLETRNGFPLREAVRRALDRIGVDASLFEGDFGIRHSGLDAVRHLYRVNSGLESMMLGETQITGQLKDAYRYAREIHELGPVVLRAFQGAFRAGKRVRTKTRIDAGAVSISFAAVELARKFFDDLSGCRALLLGAGETGSLAARHFLQHGIGSLIVINRSRERAERLVEELRNGECPRVRARDFSYLADGLAENDIVLTATGSPEPIILPEMVEAAGKLRKGKPLFLMDIAVPRDVHPAVKSYDNVYSFGIDDLAEIVNANLAARRKEIARAEKIIDHEVREFQRWMQDLELRPTVAQFRAYLEELKEKELGRIRRGAPEETAAAVEESLQGFIKNLLRRSVSRLKTAPSSEERFRDMDSLRRLFELDEEAS